MGQDNTRLSLKQYLEKGGIPITRTILEGMEGYVKYKPMVQAQKMT